MSSDESAQVAWHLVQFSEGGLPLARSLRIAAVEAPSRRLSRACVELAGQLERGKSVEEALASARLERLKPWGRWLSATTGEGRWTGLLTNLLEVSSVSRRLRMMVVRSLIYPIILLLLTMGLFGLIGGFILEDFRQTFMDFGMNLPVVTIWLLELGQVVRRAGFWLALGPLLALGASWLAARVVFHQAERARLAYQVPLLGPMLESAGWAEGCHVLAMILEQGVELPRALEDSASGLSDGNVSAVFRGAAQAVRGGRSLGEALGNEPGVPEGFGEYMQWGEAHRGLVEALRIGGELFEERAQTQARLFTRFWITVLLSLVCWWVVFVVLGLLLPVMHLMYGMSGAGGPGFFSSVLSGVSEWIQEYWTYMLALAAVLVVLILVYVMQKRRHFQERFGPLTRRARQRTRGKLGLRHVMFWLVPLSLVLVFAREAGSGALIAICAVLGPLWVISWWIGRFQRWEAQQDGLARVLALAARHGLPLSPAVEAYSQVCRGKYRWMVEGLGSRLSQGVSIQEALSRMPGLLSTRSERLIRMGAEVGPEGETLLEAGRGLEKWRVDREAWQSALLYGMVVLALVGMIGMYGAIELKRGYSAVLNEFGSIAGLDATNHPGRSVFDVMSRPLPVIRVSAMQASMACALVGALVIAVVYRRSRKRGISRLADRAVLQRAIGMGLSRGGAISEVLRVLSRSHPDRRWRGRLRQAASRVDMGEAWLKPLVEAGLLKRSEAGLVSAAGKLGNIPWAFRELAVLGERREHARARARARIFQVGLTFIVGVFVMIYALSYFYPLVWILRVVEEWVP